MECFISKVKFYELIQKTYPIIPVKTSLQILSNFKIDFFREYISITATDLDHSIIASSPASSDIEASINVNARKILEIVRELPEGDISLSIDENVLIIDNKKGFSCKIAGIGTEDFPAFPSIENGIPVSVKADCLKDMIIKSSFAVSKDESRTCLCGVYWKFEKGKTGMVATDGHRLGSTFWTREETDSTNSSIIVSPKSLLHLVRVLGEIKPESSVEVILGEKYVLFQIEGTKICSKLIEGPYPDYEKAIPKMNPKKAVIDKAALFEAVKRVSVLSNQKTHLVKCVFKHGTLEVMVLNRDIGGEAREKFAIEYDGPEHAVGFNAQYLMEIIGIIAVPKIKIEMNTHISACLLFPFFEKETDKKSDDTFLIMPLRIMEEA